MDTSESSVPTHSALHDSVPRSSKSRRDKRQYRGLTCANCRVRKVRCGGGLPRCKTCEIYDDDCRYDKTPPMSQVMALMERLQEAENTIAKLRSQSTSSSCDDAHSHLAQTPPNHEPSNAGGQDFLSPSTVSTREPLDCQPRPDRTRSTIRYPGVSTEGAPPDLSVDKNGEIQYYGPTSAVHDPPQLPLDFPNAPAPPAPPKNFSISTVISSLMSHAQESKIWEEYALGNASLQTGIPRHIIAKLLKLTWIWVSPMFMYVYRPAFIRDMATSGRYYSELLLTVMCAHAAKYQEGNYADILLPRVRRLLGEAIQQPSSIPTVQALLQLSARELANGSMSQAWVYSGIAFRMASDLGLEYTGLNVRGLGPVDLEIRKRLFWSCYFWDKATSLYAGRLPAITELPHHSTHDIVIDDSMELETWSPYDGDSLNLTRSPQNQYPASKSHAVSCFANSCKLSIIISDVILQLYSRKSRIINEAALQAINTRLDSWRTESPSHLRYDPEALPSVCPPPHIISQNILYYTTIILTHRPFWSAPSYYRVCISAAHGIEKLVLLLESTFGLENITYLMGYCIYTGASAVLEDARNSGQDAAHPVLQTFLRALQSGINRCPLLERSLNIIIRGLGRVALQRESLPSGHVNDLNCNSTGLAAASGVAPVNPYIPAFPYLDPEMHQLHFDMESYLNDNTLNMALLDSFPEMHMGSGEMDLPQ